LLKTRNYLLASIYDRYH